MVSLPALTIGIGNTSTFTVSLFIHPFTSVTVITKRLIPGAIILYTASSTVGSTKLPPSKLVHIIVPAPAVAFNINGTLPHFVVSLPALTIGIGNTSTFTVSLFIHPFTSVTVITKRLIPGAIILYTASSTVGSTKLPPSKLVHIIVPAPAVAFNINGTLPHFVVSLPALANGNEFTVIVTILLISSGQPAITINRL